jgi:hypothetical protein
MVLQIFRVTPRIKIPRSDASMDRSIRIVRQLEQVFEPYCVMLKEVKEKKEAASHHNVSAKTRKTVKNTETLFLGGWGGGGQAIILGFSVFTVGLEN